MKHSIGIISIASLVVASSASAQGLLDVAPRSVDRDTIPLTFTVGSEVGWDSNVNNSSSNEQDSTYISGNLGAEYANNTERTSVVIGASGGVYYYLDQAPGRDDTLYNARLSLYVSHAVSERLRITNNAYIAYEIEPDYVIGQSLSRRSDQYLYAYENLEVAYDLTDRITSTTGARINYITYEDNGVSTTEDRITYGVSENIRYGLNENLGVNATYRFSYTEYDETGRSTTSHQALVGMDYSMDEQTTAVFRVGAEFRLSDDFGDQTKPYFEGALTRNVTDVLTFNWLHRLGFEDSELRQGVTTSRYAYRTSMSVNYQMTEKLALNTSAYYSYADFDGPSSRTDNIFGGNVGLNYALTQMLNFGVGYSFNKVTSDSAFREYDRHRVNASVSASF